MNYYAVLANLDEGPVCELAAKVTQYYAAEQVRILAGPRQGLVMLRVRESVADGLFNAGEILVTEVRLELAGQFGYGMIMGASERRAMAVALVDAALRQGGELAQQLSQEVSELADQLEQQRLKLADIVAASKVNFETF